MDPVKMLRQRKGERPLRELAAELDCSVAYVSYVLSGQKAPSKKVLDYLGVKKVKSVTYRRKR